MKKVCNITLPRFMAVLWMTALIFITSFTSARAGIVSVTVDSSKTWASAMNVWELPANGHAYVFYGGWTVANLPAVFNGGTNLVLSPNTSIDNDVPLDTPFWWQDGSGTSAGNKEMEANVFVLDDTLAGNTVTFTGTCETNTLVSPYTSVAFIKELDGSYNLLQMTTKPLSNGQPFSVTLNSVAGVHVQYGFMTVGPNARLATVASLGKVVVSTVASAQPVSVSVDTTKTWVGYNNIFGLGGGGYQFGYAGGGTWWFGDAFDGTNTLTLSPSAQVDYDQLADASNPFWFDGGGTGTNGNKDVEHSLYVENPDLAGSTVSFSGLCLSNTLVSPYNQHAFIKVLDPAMGYSTIAIATQSLVAGQPFSLALATPAGAYIVQYGFSTYGPNTRTNRQFEWGSTVLKVQIMPVAASQFSEPLTDAPTAKIKPALVTSMFESGTNYTDVPIDTWHAGWGDTSIFSDYTPSNACTRAVKKYSNLGYAGVEFYSPHALDLTGKDTMHVDVWSPDVTKLGIKLVNTSAGTAILYPITNGITLGHWSSFDIPLSAFVGLNRSAVDQMVLIDNTDVPGPGNNGTFFLDNIYFYQSAPSAAAPTPTAPSCKVVSMYNSSATYSDATIGSWLAGWSGVNFANSGTYAIPSTSSTVKKYASLQYAGVEFYGPTIDASAMDTFHVDIWSPSGNKFAVKLVGGGADPQVSIPVSNMPAANADGWVSLDIPLSSFLAIRPDLTLTNLIQLLFVDNNTIPGGGVEGATFFVDNVYFHRSASLALNALVNGIKGSNYNHTVSASGGVAPYTYAVTAGALPAGITMDTNTGVLSGTATTYEAASFTITVTDSGTCGSVSSNYVVKVMPLKADTAAPTVKILSPKNKGVVTNAPLTVSGTAFDKTLVTAVHYWLDDLNTNNPATGDATMSFGTNWSVILPAAAAGQHTVMVQSEDLAGNKSKFASVLLHYGTNSFADLGGEYNGLFNTNNGLTGDFHHIDSGLFQVKVKVQDGKLPTFTGKLFVDGDKLGFAGTFEMTGVGTVNVTKANPSGIIDRSAYGKSNLTLTVQLPFDGSGTISGTITPVNNSWTSTMAGYLAAGPEDTNYTGNYTMVIPGSPENSATEPGGSGYGIVVITNGTIKVAGSKLGDGQAFAQKVSISEGGLWPLYSWANKDLTTKEYRSAIMGWVTVSNKATAGMNGTLTWDKQADLSVLYPNGFTSVVAVAASPYFAADPGATMILPYTVGLSNGLLTVESGGLLSSLTNSVTLSTTSGKNKITTTTTKTEKMSLSVTPKTGALKISFVDANGLVKCAGAGVVLTNTASGHGYFIRTGATQSGAFTLEGN